MNGLPNGIHWRWPAGMALAICLTLLGNPGGTCAQDLPAVPSVEPDAPPPASEVQAEEMRPPNTWRRFAGIVVLLVGAALAASAAWYLARCPPTFFYEH